MPLNREDFILNDDGDFPMQDTVVNGMTKNTPYGLSDNQHKEDLITYDKGWLSNSPLVGFGANNYLNSEFNLYNTEKKLRIVFLNDGYSIRNGIIKPNISDGFTIDPSNYSSRI